MPIGRAYRFDQIVQAHADMEANQIVQAHADMEANRVSGKLVVLT